MEVPSAWAMETHEVAGKAFHPAQPRHGVSERLTTSDGVLCPFHQGSGGQEMRKQAEKMFHEKAVVSMKDRKVLSPEETRQTLHELRVHQIELEMQNKELRTAHMKIDSLRARYFDLFNLAPVGYFTLSEHGQILEANLTAATLLGVVRDTLVKQPMIRFIHKDDQDIYYLHSKKLFETGESQTCELRVERNGDAPLWVRLEATSVLGADGAAMWHVAMSDINGHKRIEAEKTGLEVQNRQLQKAESLGRMAGAIAHHFNNQLHVVMGNLEMAMNDLTLGENPIDNLVSSQQAALKAAEVSGLMLTYLGQKPGKLEPMDLSETFRRSLTLLQAVAPKGTLLKADFPASGPIIRANAVQIMQVLTNLVTNAWESAGENRRGIGLTVRNVSQEDIPVLKRFPVDWLPQDTAYACMEVADAGSGIAKDDFEQIFDPFFSTKFTGRGLGLAVVLGIVRAHHGVVTVESTPGLGSIFRVFFPVPAEKVQHLPHKEALTLETEDGGTVLLVEDEDQVRNLVKMMLEHLGYTVLEARDGIEAVEVFRLHSVEIRCVFCDLTMPRMDGWETLAALRSLLPGIPFVLTSGYDKEQVMAGDHDEWPQAFLEKPYQFKALGDSIRHALANKPERP